MTNYSGSCHCQNVRFQIFAEIDHVRVCDCSVCKKRGALNFRIAKDQLRLLSSADHLTVYKWGTKTAEDYFCKNCGILVFRRPSDPSKEELADGMQPFSGWAVNVRCLDGVELESLEIRSVCGSKIEI